MGWYIHHVNLPSNDVPKTRAFLRDVLGFQTGDWCYPEKQGELHHDDNSIAFFGSGNRGIHAVRPIPTFAADNGFVHNPTVGGHFALTVPDLKPVMQRFDEAGVVYSDAGIYAMAGVQQIYVYDPSMNVIEINQLHDQSGGAPPPTEDEQHGIWMEPGDWYIHHVNIPSHDVRATVAFFRDLVGLTEGVWAYPDQVGDFDRESDALANFGTENRGIHIVKPDPAFAMKNGFKHNPTVGGHKAFTVKDIGAVIDRLNKAGIDYTDAGTYAMDGVHQVYVFDPSFNFIEVNQVA
ncbi:MAG: catechol 2,3-dioxygenase-like lactoylglutathione lyase family enzyme [Hyphomicrobiaceae bacterium]|jgi:catechol 2,3-dioxygenase-like lactoylglutathione lyase family enzyme